MKHLKPIFVLVFFTLFFGCKSTYIEEISKKKTNSSEKTIDFWLTKKDESIKLEKQNTYLIFGSLRNSYANIEINETDLFQTVDGFGFALTGGSAEVINQLNNPQKKELLYELFGNTDKSISVSYLRISIGASDLDAKPFSYNDLDTGKTDVQLKHFSIAPDLIHLIPLLKEIIAINPKIKIMASPWSAPVWMKDNNSTIGGSLKPEYYEVYAQYFVKYIQNMKDQGIIIDAITPQNEPLHHGNNPSMLMSANQQADFIKNHLGPALKEAQLTTKIVVYDHNCNKPEYPISVLNDPKANEFIDGSAFHLYEGDISALSTVHNAHPNKNLYFTEQYTSSNGVFGEDLVWHINNVIIGSMRNWSKNALEWNLANNSFFAPHTDGGCTTCKGAITINNNENFTRNVSYYIIAHASKFIPTGSIRIGSNMVENISNVTFKTPDGRYVLIALNTNDTFKIFNIKQNDKWFTTTLQAGDVGTYIW
jgi:glucosylceramidase